MATAIISPLVPSLELPHNDTPPSIDRTTTILLTTFAGLDLPRTLSLPVASSTSIRDLLSTIFNRLPEVNHPLIVTTTSNKQLLPSSTSPISTLLSSQDDTFLPLRLNARLSGGKGGFGSQLRAAGGRMSSRKKRNQADQNPNGSNRNLDGRRLRTVDEAKKLAEYLAIKPDMEQKEKEERRKRWEAVVEAAEKKEEDLRHGRTENGRLDAGYVEGKEVAEERTREAVTKAMREGMLAANERTGSESSMEVDGEDSDEDAEEGSSGSSEEAKVEKEAGGRSFFGWDEEDEDDSDGEDGAGEQPPPVYQGKGKGKAS